jgi:hypothetical protein
MSMRRCIPELQGQNKLSRDQAEHANNLFEDLERDYSTKFGKQAAEAMASEEAVKRLEAEAAIRKRQAALQVTAQQAIAQDVRRFRGDNPGAAAEALLASDDRSPYFNVEFRSKAIANEHFAMMNGILEKHSRNVLGQVRDVAGLNDFVRERFGENSGNVSAKELSDAFGETAESLRLRFNESGGAIGKLENWGMPQVHNMLAVRSASYEEWRDFIRPMLDPQKMLDQTGSPMSPGQLELALRAVKETIDSDGWNERRAGAFTGSKLANRHRDSRFLVFKDADSWLAYAQRFGRPLSGLSEKIDPGAAILDAMISHVHGMSRDIALMQRLGPNPAATMRWITDGLKIEAHQSKHAGTNRIKKAKASSIRVQNMFQELTGGFDVENEGLARFMQGVRTWESGSKLGGAVFSSTGDVATQIATRRFNGLPSVRVVGDYAGSLKPSSAADRSHAARQLYIADRAIRTMSSYSRWTGETMSGEIPARLSDAVMQLSYLSKWTDDGHRLYNEATWAAITDNSGLSWDTLKSNGTLLNPTHRFRQMLERYGIGESEWDLIRKTPLEESGGAHWILPSNIEDRRLTQRLAEMILTESDFAVPTSSLRIRSAVNARFHKGSIPGEIGRSVLLFRGFPMQLFWMHGRRMLSAGGARGLEYASTLFITSTVMGMLAYQLKQIVAGKDPVNMDPTENPVFLAQSAFQGGGLGIMGDFINSATSRSGQDFWTTMGGPVGGSIDDIRQLITARYRERYPNDPLLKGQNIDPEKAKSATGRRFRQLIQNNTPGSTLWYARLAFSREVLDQLQSEIDPDYYSSFGRMEKSAQQNNTAYWWKPGRQAPERAPKLKNATGSR